MSSYNDRAREQGLEVSAGALGDQAARQDVSAILMLRSFRLAFFPRASNVRKPCGLAAARH